MCEVLKRLKFFYMMLRKTRNLFQNILNEIVLKVKTTSELRDKAVRTFKTGVDSIKLFVAVIHVATL
jgi:hypothetical protein